ncbi:hypothetical protein ACH5RR_037464 [Cinchona calisaya]|uniref:Late blight resistance protein homolog R1A-3 n=1 Tax=Cinchona calisaya TaxID=153742 RepID=A0ABD2YAG7_9GENT
MASSTCFNSTLVDLEFLRNVSAVKDGHKFKKVSDGLRYLRTFHMFARKWGNDDPSLEALLVRIEATVLEVAQKIQPFHLSLDDDYRDDIDSFNQEINLWYINFSDCSRQSCSPVRDELLEFIDCLLENLVDFLFWRDVLDNSWLTSIFYYYWNLICDEAFIELLEALKEKLIFLKNFIRFTALQGTDHVHMGHLLTHIKTVAVSAAHVSYIIQFENNDENVRKEIQFKIQRLLQSIKPSDPQVFEAYIQALTASKLSKHSPTVTLEVDEHILEDFLDSILSNLWEILKSSTFPKFSTKHQLQILYEGLRSLRNILKKQPKNFDEKMWDISWIVVSDAGLITSSLFMDAMEDGMAKKMDSILLDLLERIKLIREKFGEQSTKGSTLNFPKVDELGFIDFLIQNLAELRAREDGSIVHAKHQIHTIQEQFVSLRPFLGKIVELRNEQQELHCLWSRVVELAYRVELLIDSLVIEDILEYSPMPFDSIIEEIKIIKLDGLKIFDRECLDKKLKKVTKKSHHLSSERSMPLINDDIVGFEDEATSIMDRLKNGARKLQIVAIVGMAGLGKTTLAKIVYNDFSITSHFHIRAWCCVSQVYDKKHLLLEILTCVFGKLSNKYFGMNEEDLALELYRSLKRNRYLIILDDVWDIDAWNSLEASFPDDANGSRIIYTSRLLDVAPKEKLDQEPHFLRQLTDDESWKLFKAKLFPGDDWPPTLHELGTQLVEWCKGLPLTIVILAGILSTMEQDGWKEVVENLSPSTVSSTEKCKNMLELSYIHLPNKLKPCLLYFGAFPEDQELTTKKLTVLWIAEGFVRKTESKSLEDKAKDFLMRLISRSLVMVTKKTSSGGVKTCRIHDLLHEFCVEKAKEERFFQFLQGSDELFGFNEPHNLRRMCIYSTPEQFKMSKLFCPRVRCLLFFDPGERFRQNWLNLSFITGIFKLVRVLDLSQINLGISFPIEVELLAQLRYLAVGGRMKSTPSSIAKLANLETLVFIVEALVQVVLPNTVWNLKKLRHLQINNSYEVGFSLPDNDLDNAAELCNLDTFSNAMLPWENPEKTLRKFPNIRKLKGKLFESNASYGENNKVLALNYLSKLESLKVYPFKTYRKLYQIEFCFPLNLKKLTLSGFFLPWCNISTIGNLPNLEVLKLLGGAFRLGNWDMEGGQFPKLIFLKLEGSIVRWTASESEDGHLPCLVKLVLNSCYSLEEVPSCLGDSSTLQMIEMFDCSVSAASSVKQIQVEQESMGNENLKVVISSCNWGST